MLDDVKNINLCFSIYNGDFLLSDVGIDGLNLMIFYKRMMEMVIYLMSCYGLKLE